ncbi:CrcB family protein [Nocardiopsis sp. CNT312]|uniref:fluoride efflux transporter FluC n=1 Tax=Nocardiopsis sp. CNT312 TaxID=1137268 RepID=UPI00048D25B6|nr:CrcB family protein [Nocardiopsis sp. CNT312]
MTLLMVAIGGALGAPLRYLTDRFVQTHHDSVFPWGTHAANAIACLLLGSVTVLALPAWAYALVATGFLGALSTYSTFGYETLRLMRRETWFLAVANVLASVGAGLGGAFVGAAVAAGL